MKKEFFFFLLIYSIFNYSQNKITITDSISKEILPYAIITFNDNSSLYSNEKGSFIVKNDISSFEISYMGYETKKITLKTLKDTIKLNRSIRILNEVIISTRVQKKKINFLKSPNTFGNYVLKPESEIFTTVIPTFGIVDMVIDKVFFSFQKLKLARNKKKLKDELAVIRINIYNLKNELPNELLFSSEAMKINAYEKDLLEVNLKNELLTIGENGLAFSIEYIGNINNKGEFYKTDDLYLRPELAENENEFYKGDLLQKFQLREDKNEIINIVDYWNKTFSEKKKISQRILNISLELSK